MNRDGCTTLERHAAHFKDMVPHTATLTRLAARARTVIELGVRGGVSTWALLDGLPADGELVSVDNDGRCIRQVPARVADDPRWSFLAGDDRNPDLWAGLPLADLVLIDTSHTYGHTRMEMAMAGLHQAQTIVLHDWNIAGVEEAGRDFRRAYPHWLLDVEPSDWGLAVFRR